MVEINCLNVVLDFLKKEKLVFDFMKEWYASGEIKLQSYIDEVYGGGGYWLFHEDFDNNEKEVNMFYDFFYDFVIEKGKESALVSFLGKRDDVILTKMGYRDKNGFLVLPKE